jgi:hypothetical protein
MIECVHCTYPRNPDTATNCVKCRALLTRRGTTQNENDFQGQRSRTAVEDVPFGEGRRQTVAEGVGEPGGLPPSGYIPTTETPRWNDASAHGAGISSGQAGSATAVASGSGGAKGPGAAEPSRRRTMYAGVPPAEEPVVTAPRAPAGPGVGGVRKIVGILITYSWEEQGQVFPVLEGRNLIGKDPTQCNICISQDQTLSDVNSSIAYRSQFVIRDKDSMSGTFVDGAYVEAEPIPLRNYAKIRTGSTNWTFVAIQPQTASGTPTAATTDSGVDA